MISDEQIVQVSDTTKQNSVIMFAYKSLLINKPLRYRLVRVDSPVA